jgi:hypothetical protein
LAKKAITEAVHQKMSVLCEVKVRRLLRDIRGILVELVKEEIARREIKRGRDPKRV